MVDVGTAFEDARDGIEGAVELGLPAMLLVDHMAGEEAPDAAVPFFIRRVGVDGAERGGGADSLGAGPPITIRLIRSVAPVERVVEAAKLLVPADRRGLVEQLDRGFDHPRFAAASELPELD